MKNSALSSANIRDPGELKLLKFTDWSDTKLQSYLLQGVSRTFALTIPQLPNELCFVVSNAYLLCRIVDTIEDEPALNGEEKREFCLWFVTVVKGEEKPGPFARKLGARLSQNTIPAEHELIALMPRIIHITINLREEERRVLERCVEVMAEGMAEFQNVEDPFGLKDLDELDRYCYVVAGVVGELLTQLFCIYSPAVAKNREGLMQMAISFGQGLQMTNILKDMWTDNSREECWLPRDYFENAGLELNNLDTIREEAQFSKILGQLIGITHSHILNALSYVLLIPRKEVRVRKFCLWNLGMALLTLRNINGNRSFRSGDEIKISRNLVRATILATHISARFNTLLKLLFLLVGFRLPRAKSLHPVRSRV
tara:strand:+ start:11952 stop:13061 length:1110 start_codon:yes stop_codon:yes gene_type:complete